MADASLNEINGVPLYKPSDPYHHDYDNKPIKSLVERDNLIIGIVNVLKSIIDQSGGNLGSLPVRLNQSIDPDGNIKPSAIDEVNHNIANHEDGRKTISQQELNYYTSLGYAITNNPKFVRYLEEERAKLALISEEANRLLVAISPEGSSKHVVDNGEVNFQSSDTIDVEIDNNNSVRFNSKFPTSIAHQHYYQVEPTTSDLVNYNIPGVSSFKEGSLRVYINGCRIEHCDRDCGDINFSYYPSFRLVNSNLVVEWKTIYYTEDQGPAAPPRSFYFSSAVSQSDRVLVDYDISLA